MSRDEDYFTSTVDGAAGHARQFADEADDDRPTLADEADEPEADFDGEDSPEMTAALARFPREALRESGIPGVPPTLVQPTRLQSAAEAAAARREQRELLDEPDVRDAM